MYDQKPIAALENAWAADPRWQRIRRSYTAEDVVRLRGSIQVEHTLARMGADKLWRLLHTVPFLRALGALTGNQAIQQVQAGLKAIYVSGWQIAGDANTAGHVYPDHSLYPADGAPSLIRRINNALMRADQIQHMEGRNDIDWFAPIVADAEAGFGGTLNTFELVKAMIEAGAAEVHLSGTELAIAHAVAFAPYADMLWCETSTPDLGVAREFAQGVHAQYPGKLLAYNCSPSFNWKRHLDDALIGSFQEKLAEMGYKFQFITLAGFHALNTSMFHLARAYRDEGRAAYARLQEQEFQLERDYGYKAVKHRSFVGAGYFDEVQMAVSGGQVSTAALKGSTEEKQFQVAASPE